MKTKKLDKKLSLKKKTVINLNMAEVKGGALTRYCEPTYTVSPCLTWTLAPCTLQNPERCITNADSDPCC